MIEIKKITKNYSQYLALDNVSFNIPKGQIYGLIGHNGAGKTSLIRILMQIIKPDSGDIFINGEILSAKHRSVIGYLPEERGLYKKMSVWDYLIFLAKLREISKPEREEKIGRWLSKFGLLDIKNKEIGQLSKGNQQKVQFIATVFFEPEILILDEPFSGFDPSNVELLKTEIKELQEKGTTIIFSTHQMEAVEELCENFTMINKSKVVLSGGLKEVKKQFVKNEFLIELKENRTIPLHFKSEKQKHKYLLQLNENQLIENFIKEIGLENLKSFEEKEPSLREIFLQKTKENA